MKIHGHHQISIYSVISYNCYPIAVPVPVRVAVVPVRRVPVTVVVVRPRRLLQEASGRGVRGGARCAGRRVVVRPAVGLVRDVRHA